MRSIYFWTPFTSFVGWNLEAISWSVGEYYTLKYWKVDWQLEGPKVTLDRVQDWSPWIWSSASLRWQTWVARGLCLCTQEGVLFKGPNNFIINPSWFACLIHSFNPLMFQIISQRSRKAKEKCLTSFLPASWSILSSSSPLRQGAFSFMINLTLGETVLLPSPKHCVLSWREFPWLILNQCWVRNGVTLKGKCMIPFHSILPLFTTNLASHH